MASLQVAWSPVVWIFGFGSQAAIPTSSTGLCLALHSKPLGSEQFPGNSGCAPCMVLLRHGAGAQTSLWFNACRLVARGLATCIFLRPTGFTLDISHFILSLRCSGRQFPAVGSSRHSARRASSGGLWCWRGQPRRTDGKCLPGVESAFLLYMLRFRCPFDIRNVLVPYFMSPRTSAARHDSSP